jgi:cation-transporting ATPase 13A3/4/5
MEHGMAVCHTLTKTIDGLYIGTFIDEVMFKASESSMSTSRDGPPVIDTKAGAKLKILKRFEFDHSTMTQSVIVGDNNGKVFTYVKGSAESIQRICTKESLPNDFFQMSENASREGIYQISLAIGDAPAPKMGDTGVISYAFVSRFDVEKNLQFVGFMDFKNTLREETPETIKHLKQGSVECTMVTGDSVFTG